LEHSSSPAQPGLVVGGRTSVAATASVLVANVERSQPGSGEDQMRAACALFTLFI